MTALGYSTPGKLMRLVLEAAAAGPSGRARWARCADLGCGTGLAGVEARPHVAFLAGCDLSGGMVAEARARLRPGGIAGGGGSGDSTDDATTPSLPLYDHLDVAEIEAWLRGPAARGGFDLVLAADVLVYVGSLDGIFRAVAAAMGACDAAAGGAAGGAASDAATEPAPAPSAAPRLFAFSTEAFPGEGEDEGEDEGGKGEGEGKGEDEGGSASGGRAGAGAAPGFALTGTGRCVHSRRYVRRVARAHGFSERRALRAAIRKNAGADVVGDLFVFAYAAR